MLAVMIGPASPLLAQVSASGTDRAENSVPDPGKVLKVIDKATAAQPGEGASDWSAPVKLAVVFTLLTVLPSLLVMMTSFTRIVIVLAFLRRALTTQNIPPTIALVGLALFLTLFTMAPVLSDINEKAIGPYLNDQINFFDACGMAQRQLKNFMFRQTRSTDLELFVGMSDIAQPESVEDIPSHVMIPSFAISEFRTAFEMGCLIFIPFLVVDLVTSAILLSTGMMMLPPAMISLPFKIILFVLVDGWRLVASALVSSFN